MALPERGLSVPCPHPPGLEECGLGSADNAMPRGAGNAAASGVEVVVLSWHGEGEGAGK